MFAYHGHQSQMELVIGPIRAHYNQPDLMAKHSQQNNNILHQGEKLLNSLIPFCRQNNFDLDFVELETIKR